MKWQGSISPGRILAGGTGGVGWSLALLGLLEALYHAPGQPAAWLYGACLYGLAGAGYGFLYALLFGGSGRRDQHAFEIFLSRTIRWPVLLLVLGAGGFLVWRDAWGESLSGAGWLGWLTLLALLPGCWLLLVICKRLALASAARPLGAMIVLGLALPAGFWGSAGQVGPPALVLKENREVGGETAKQGSPVILVVADALRADQTGPYTAGVSTPNLEDFARHAVVFENAWSAASWTRPSVTSILTGLLPRQHGTVHKASRLPGDIPTVASLLDKAGWNTAAVVTNVNLAPVFGLGRGFSAYAYLGPEAFLGAPGAASRLFLVELWRLVRLRFLPGQRRPERYYAPGEKINLQAGRYLEQLAGDGPFFLYLHYMEPHDPYFAHPYDGRAVARVETPHPPVERAEQLLDLYRQEVSHWDEIFGQLLEQLRRLGVFDSALIIVTADHGEEFADHGGFWHGTTLYQELVRVPLMVHFPGGSGAGTRRADNVSLLDLLPTIMAQAGGQVPENLFGYPLQAAPRPDRVIMAEEDHQGARLVALRRGSWKIIHSLVEDPRGQPEWQLFALDGDPSEKDNLAEQRTGVLEELKKLLEQGPAALNRGTEDVEIDHQTEEQLRSLGYTQ